MSITLMGHCPCSRNPHPAARPRSAFLSGKATMAALTRSVASRMEVAPGEICDRRRRPSLIALLQGIAADIDQPLDCLGLFPRGCHRPVGIGADGEAALAVIEPVAEHEGPGAGPGVATIAEEAITSARDLFALISEDRERILSSGSASVSAIRLFELLPRHPIVSVASAVKLVDASKPTAIRAIGILEEAGILAETTGRKRDRSFAYHGYLDLLRVGTDLEGRR